MWTWIEEHWNETDLAIGAFILFVVIVLIITGLFWGLHIASDIACRNLGYEGGYITNLLSPDGMIVCESSYDIAIPDMWRGP